MPWCHDRHQLTLAGFLCGGSYEICRTGEYLKDNYLPLINHFKRCSFAIYPIQGLADFCREQPPVWEQRNEEWEWKVHTALGILLYWKYLSVFSIDFFTLFPIAIAVQLPLFVRHGDHEGKGWKMKINYIWPSRLTLDKLDQMWKHWFLATGRSWSAGGPLQQMINPANDRWMNIKGKNKKKWTGKT